MKKKIILRSFASALVVCALTMLTTVALGLSRAPTKPLSERVGAATMVFVGKLVNKVEEDGWIRAELIVEEALKNADPKTPVLVTWRKLVWNGQLIFDVKEDARGVAILSDKHEGRFWFRADKFEDLKQLDKVKEILENTADDSKKAAAEE